MTVTQVETTTLVTLTETAAQKLAEIMDEKGMRETHALRVFVSGGGCSGFQYGMGFDDAPRETDTVSEQHGLRMVIDPQSLEVMSGATVDYIDHPTSGGFHIENPNSMSQCGSGGCSGCG